MKTISFICQEYYQNDKLFDKDDSEKNRDNCLLPWILLKEELEKKGFTVHTNDLLDPKNSDFRVYIDNVSNDTGLLKGSFLFLIESSIIQPQGWVKKNHNKFEKIFAWGYDEKDGPKYRHIFIPQAFPEPKSGKPFSEKKLVCLISGNKESTDRRELYGERRKIIRWYEKNDESNFDLYGRGWESGESKIPLRMRKLFPFLNNYIKRQYSSFKGTIENKQKVLENYKFTYCYENSREFKGYITEKIFDPMFAGCVPIYLGAPDILQYVPRDCFIDPSKFSNLKELNHFLKTMSQDDYASYQNRISKYIHGDSIKRFTAEYFSKKLAEEFS